MITWNDIAQRVPNNKDITVINKLSFGGRMKGSF